MADLRITFKDDNIGEGLRRSMRRNSQRVREALFRTASEASEEIVDRGREDISNAGNFGRRWTEGLSADVENEDDGDLAVSVHHTVPYFMVFEKGKRIFPRRTPLLWIPLEFADDAQGVMARDFPGGLFRVDRKGAKAPLLLSLKTGEPKYFGKEFVTIPQKFHIREICRTVARNMRDIYRKQMARIQK